ncbi:splicing factor U2af large subunit A-like [Prosopis cineraria]|uniref:splicing factor U2af large subunit A-like n=1 Tax=Prosopis cineraria TaxID=364024 RepID=UPI00240EAF0E|nr:splicing factor U2af large subunit A-like [Prosopis cineraria]
MQMALNKKNLDGADAIIVSGLPDYITETQMREFLETFGPIRGFELVKARDTRNSESYACCVYQDPAVTDIVCAALNGIKSGDKTLTVRRPNQGENQPKPALKRVMFQQELAATKSKIASSSLAISAADGLDGPDCLFVGGLPDCLRESEIRALVETFGQLRGFELVKDRDTGISKGYAFCAYQDPVVTDIACAALNGIKFGDKTLILRRAPKPEQESRLTHGLQRLTLQPELVATKVVCLSQAISAADLKDDEDYEEIVDDMRREGSKYATIVFTHHEHQA